MLFHSSQRTGSPKTPNEMHRAVTQALFVHTFNAKEPAAYSL